EPAHGCSSWSAPKDMTSIPTQCRDVTSRVSRGRQAGRTVGAGQVRRRAGRTSDETSGVIESFGQRHRVFRKEEGGRRKQIKTGRVFCLFHPSPFILHP